MKLFVTTTLEHPYIDYIVIENVTVQLDTCACIQVLLCNWYGTELTTRNLCMSGADYTAWGVDDTAVQDFVLTELGLSLTETGSDGYQLDPFGSDTDGPDAYQG